MLGACGSDWIGRGDTEPPLPGERVSVLVLERELVPDPTLDSESVSLPAPVVNEAWPQVGGQANHVMQHLDGGVTLSVDWRYGFGVGENADNLILNTPVVAGGVAYTLDSESTILALDLVDRSMMWSVELLPDSEDDSASLGGGVAYDQGFVFATSAFGDIVALNAASGDRIWTANIGVPIRGAPTVAGGRVFAVSYDNQLHALNASTGETLWTHSGITETAGLLGAGAPAVSGDLVIAPYSSGEVFALRVENGRVAWSDSLIFQGRVGASTKLSDVDGSPVIDADKAYVTSQSGRLVAYDLRSGARLWDQEIGGVQTPWLAGSYLFVVTADNDLACLRRADGRIKWVRALPQFEDPDDRRGVIIWSGPVLVGDRLIVVSNLGDIWAISPYSGETLAEEELPDGARVPPVVAGGTVYVYTVDADLVALR